MILQQVKRTRDASGTQTLSGILTFETPVPRSFRTYFVVEGAPGEITGDADPFVIGFVVYAMLLGEDLEIRAPVDSELLGTIRNNVMPLLRDWFPFLAEIDLIAREERPPSPRSAEPIAAAAFGGGLDATFTVARHRKDIDWLATSHGYDVRTHYREQWDRTFPDLRHSAEALGKPLLVVTSNLKEVSHYEAIRTRRGRINPRFYELGRTGPIGVYLASLGRTLLPFCDTFFLAGTFCSEESGPYGTHPKLDPLWSTSLQRIIHDGQEYTRLDKIDFLARDYPELLAGLRVCLKPEYGTVNCSRCSKCLRTMAEITACGCEGLASSFQWPLDIEALGRADTSDAGRPFWIHLEEEAQKRGHTRLAAAVREALRQPRSLAQWLQSGRRREKLLMREHWKFARNKLKPPPGSSFEVETPAD